MNTVAARVAMHERCERAEALNAEMLEALQTLVKAVEYWGFDRYISTIDARAAIAKATGGGK